MRLYGLGYLVAGLNIFTAIRLTSYGKGHWSAVVTLLRSFLLLIVFLLWLPKVWGMAGLWLAMPLAEMITIEPEYHTEYSQRKSECCAGRSGDRIKKVAIGHFFYSVKLGARNYFP